MMLCEYVLAPSNRCFYLELPVGNPFRAPRVVSRACRIMPPGALPTATPTRPRTPGNHPPRAPTCTGWLAASPTSSDAPIAHPVMPSHPAHLPALRHRHQARRPVDHRAEVVRPARGRVRHDAERHPLVDADLGAHAAGGRGQREAGQGWGSVWVRAVAVQACGAGGGAGCRGTPGCGRRRMGAGAGGTRRGAAEWRVAGWCT